MSSLFVLQNTVSPSNDSLDRTVVAPEVARRGRAHLLAIIAVCAAPAVASYGIYYGVQPRARTNYGELVEPQRPASAIAGRSGAGRPFAMDDLRGKWIFVTPQAGPCDADCIARLYAMRQVRATTGKDMERIERVLLLTGGATLPPLLAAEHPGLISVQADAAAVAMALAPDGPTGAEIGHVYLIDPLGNLMMRFPRQADPNRMKKDIAKLLRASRIG
jgi:hypothetical protein